ncbi:MAG: ABC transporter substrate-binding protein, partial [Candidatus Nanopelagicaceae bacterium]|nr:ABC transporter substrate-binding protein [Candidatus Nanopelagicaceae bacterium]
MKSKKFKVFGLLAIALALVASTAPATSAKVAPAKAKSAVEAGGLKELIKLAKKEGQVNTIALPDYWANYGEVKKAFEAKYGIKVNSFDPEASSAEELVAVRTLKGQDRMPDVVDVGLQFAVQGAQEGLWAPYKVSTWNDIPNDAKEANGLWYS